MMSSMTTEFSALTLSVRHQEEHLAFKQYRDKVLLCLHVWSKKQTICMWSSWCHCHPIISCFIKIQNGSAFLVPAPSNRCFHNCHHHHLWLASNDPIIVSQMCHYCTLWNIWCLWDQQWPMAKLLLCHPVGKKPAPGSYFKRSSSMHSCSLTLLDWSAAIWWSALYTRCSQLRSFSVSANSCICRVCRSLWTLTNSFLQHAPTNPQTLTAIITTNCYSNDSNSPTLPLSMDCSIICAR